MKIIIILLNPLINNSLIPYKSTLQSQTQPVLISKDLLQLIIRTVLAT